MNKIVIFSLLIIATVTGILTGFSIFEIDYEVKINTEGKGAVNPEAGSYRFNENEIIEIEAIPEAGWKFKEWQGDVREPQNIKTEIKISENSQITAVFEFKGIEYTEEFTEGEGSKANPYHINTAAQLNNVRNHLNQHFKLTENIDLSNFTGKKGWQPIGSQNNPFTGSFIGDGYKITNLTIKRDENNDIGLFSVIDNGKIQNITLENVDISGKTAVGGIAGWNLDGKIIESSVSGEIWAADWTGGITGINSGQIEKSYTDVEIFGDEQVGGLTGVNNDLIKNSYTQGEITGNAFVGGINGVNSEGIIEKSYAVSNVRATRYSGGIAAIKDQGKIKNSYFADNIIMGPKDDDYVRSQLHLKEANSNTVIDEKNIYQDWDDNIWDFGSKTDHPELKY